MRSARGPLARTRRRRGGFTIVELLVAIIVLSVGMLGMGSLLASSTRLARLGDNRAELLTFAEAKLEELRSYAAYGTAPAVRAKLAIGGSTTVTTAGYADSTQDAAGGWYYRRWQITQGVAGTRSITLRIVPRQRLPYLMSRNLFTTLVVLQ